MKHFKLFLESHPFTPDHVSFGDNDFATFIYYKEYIWFDRWMTHDEMFLTKNYGKEISKILNHQINKKTSRREAIDLGLIIGRIGDINRDGVEQKSIAFWNDVKDKPEIIKCLRLLLSKKLITGYNLVSFGGIETTVKDINKIETDVGNWIPEQLSKSHTSKLMGYAENELPDHLK